MTKKSADSFLHGLLFAFDFAAVYCSYLLSFFFYEHWIGSSPQPLEEVARLSTIPALFAVAAFVLTGLYRCQPGPLGLDQLKRLLSAYFWSGILTISLSFYTKSQGYSRLMVNTGFVFGIFLILFGRALFIRITSPIRSNYLLNRRILILGAGQVGKSLARNLLNSPGGFEVVGFLDDLHPQLHTVTIKIGERERTLPILGTLGDLEKICREYRINEVIVAMTKAAHAIHQDLLEKVRDLRISFSIVPSVLELMLTGAQAYSIGRIPLFRIGERPQFILSPVLKRSFDIAGSLIIGILISPLLLIVALIIKLDSKGPVFFIHERVGKDGRLFKLFKFRSMSTSVDPYSVKLRDQGDGKITPFGRFLRRTSIDELPQLLNVLIGHMSLVGPRPEMPFIVEGYDEIQKLRLTVKPGLTGVWQISADRANPIHENIDYDLYYLENQSFWLDLAILVKTFTSVVKGVGAY